MPQTQTIAYYGSVAASSNLTLASKPINRPFKVERLRSHFALNTNKTLRLSFFLSNDPTTPTAAAPPGLNLLLAVGNVDYLVGDDETVEIPHQALSPTYPAYVKVFAVNTDTNPHTVDAQVTVTIDPDS